MTDSSTLIVTPDQLASIRASAGTNLAGTYSNGPVNNGVGATFIVPSSSLVLDEVVMKVGERCALVAQTNAFENGIYDVTAIGSVVILTRSADFQSTAQIRLGKYAHATEGTVGAASILTVVAPQVAAVGIDPIVMGSTPSLIAVYTLPFAGGANNNTFLVPGMTGDHVVVATIHISGSPATIQRIAPGIDQLSVVYDADPGGNTIVMVIATLPTQTVV